MPAMLTSWSRAIFTEGWASIISSTRARTGSEWGRESVVHQSPQSNPSVYLFKTPHIRTTAAPQIKLLYWTSGVASLHQPIPALTICPSWTSFCMHLCMNSHEIQTGESLTTLRRGQINLMETPGLPVLAHSTWMTSFRFADKITHQLWNRNCLRLQIDGQADSFKADRQSQGQSRTDRHAVSLLKWVTCIRLEPMCKYMLHVFALLYCYLYIFCVSLFPDWRPKLKQRGQSWINAGLGIVKEQKEDTIGIKGLEPYRSVSNK